MKKTNKTFKRFAAITSASLLAACAMAPVAFNAYAVNVSVDTKSGSLDPDYDKDVASHNYKAYQIFTGTYDTSLGLTVKEWGTDYDSEGLLEDATFRAIILEKAVVDNPETADDETKAEVTIDSFIGNKTDAATVAQAIEKLNSADETIRDNLAEILAKYAGGEGTTLSTDATAPTNLTEGYYVVKDNYSVGTTGQNDALSKFILKVAGDTPITIIPKKSYPTVIKKVKENESGNTISDFTDPTTLEGAVDVDDNWNDVGDYAIGEPIDFMLYGSLPSTLADYTNGYKYVFHDTIAPSLTLIDGDDTDTNVDVTVTINDNTVDPSKYTVASTSDGFTVTFNDIKSAAEGVTADSIVKVAYQAKLNENAVIGQLGQTNEVYLEYSNNPEWSGEASNNTTDKTAVDKVVVFTYELDVTKIDGATKVKLENAVFNLYRGTGDNKEYVVVDASGKVTGWTKDANAASPLTSDANGLFKIIGIDEGTYSLKEITPPNGYNALESDISLTITATTSNTQGEDADGTELTALTLTSGTGDDAITYNATATDKYGIAKIDVANNKGTTLPGTGGIGTTIFYLGGGAMAAIGGVYLISKRRMKKSEE